MAQKTLAELADISLNEQVGPFTKMHNSELDKAEDDDAKQINAQRFQKYGGSWGFAPIAQSGFWSVVITDDGEGKVQYSQTGHLFYSSGIGFEELRRLVDTGALIPVVEDSPDMVARQKIFSEIKAERAYQNEKWGNGFDDKNTINDWSSYISRYISNATFAKADTVFALEEQQRKQLVKVAALAVAALECFDRNGGFRGRHYDLHTQPQLIHDIKQAAARGYCTPRNGQKVLDAELIEDMASEIIAVVR